MITLLKISDLKIDVGTDEITKFSIFIYDSFKNKKSNLSFWFIDYLLTGKFKSKTILSHKSLPLEIFLRCFIRNVLPTIILNPVGGIIKLGVIK